MSEVKTGREAILAMCHWPHAPDDQMLHGSNLGEITVGDLRELLKAHDAYQRVAIAQQDLANQRALALASLRLDAMTAIEPFRLHRLWARSHSWPADVANDPGTPVLGAPDGEGGLAGEVSIGDFDRIAALGDRLSRAMREED